MLKINLIASLAASVIFVFVSVFFLTKIRRSYVNRYYVYYNTSALGIFITMFLSFAFPDILDTTMINKFTQMFTMIFGASFFAVSLVFPESESKISSYKILMLILPAFIAGALIINTDLTILKASILDGELIREFNFYYMAYAAIIALYLLSAVIIFIIKYIRIKIPLFRKQIGIIFIGGSVLIILAMFSSVILPVFFNYTRLYVLAPAIASLIWALLLYYAVAAYNLMDIRTGFHKTVLYLIISAVIIVPIGSLICFYFDKNSLIHKIPSFLLSVSIVFIFLVYSLKIQPIIDKLFKKNSGAYKKLLNSSRAEIITIKNTEEIVKKASELLYDSFALKNIAVLLFNKEDKQYKLFFKLGNVKNINSIDNENPVIKWFNRISDILEIDQIYKYYSLYGEMLEVINKIFVPLNIKIIIPLLNDKQVIALICMGEKNNFKRFRNNEVRILREFQKEINYYISNSIDSEEYSQSQFMRGLMDLSSEILSRAVPVNLPKISEISFGAFYIPKYREGIDYFDFLHPTNTGVGVIATDISGRGINNAIYSVILRSSFHSCIEDVHSTFATMQKLNNTLHDYTKGRGGIARAYYFYFNISTMRLTYTNAGFQPLEIYRVDKNVYESLDTEGFPLGTEPNSNYGMGRTNLLLGDIGFLCSRALIDSKNNKGDNFGLTQLRRIIKENRRKHPSEIAGIIKEEFSLFMGLATPLADILVIIFKV